jgi:hypothetical protein
MLTVAEFALLKDRAPYLCEALTRVVSAVNVARQRAAS